MPALSTPPPHRDTPPLPAAPSPSALTPSPNPAPPPDSWGWTPTQRRALATLLALLLIFLVIETLHRPARLSAPQSDTHPLHLPPLLDPNTASEADLAMLPHVGQKLAAAIITYRTTHQPLTPDHPLFQTPQDLTHIPGLSKSTATQLTPYLSFPKDPDSQPATEHLQSSQTPHG